MKKPDATRILEALVALFYERPEELGQFVEVEAEAMPAVEAAACWPIKTT